MGNSNSTYKTILIFLGRALSGVIAVGVFLVLTQDIQVFPGCIAGLFQADGKVYSKIPQGVEGRFVETEDGESIEVWRYPSTESRAVAIVFHGNGQSLDYFFSMQKWLKALGITSYGFDYRGFGRSSGWPSEKGIYLDAEAVLEHVSKTEKVVPEEIIIVGISIGTGPASYIAKTFKSKLLVLFSPFQSIAKVAADRVLTKYLQSFLWYDFPTEEYVSELENTSLVVTHGELDTIIPVGHGRKVFESFKGHDKFAYFSPESGHNDLFFITQDRVGTVIRRYLEKGQLN